MRWPFKVFETCSKLSLGLIGRQNPLGAQFTTPQASSEDSSGLNKFSPWELQVLSPGPKVYRFCRAQEGRPLAWQGEQAELQTTVPLRVPSKSTIQGMLLPPQPVRCSVDEVYGGLALSRKVYSCTLTHPLSLPLLLLSSSLVDLSGSPFKRRPCWVAWQSWGKGLLYQHRNKCTDVTPTVPGRVLYCSVSLR